jgi:hypothetical protein
MYYLGAYLGLWESDNGPQLREVLLLPMAGVETSYEGQEIV